MVDSYWQRCAQSSRQFERAQKFLAGGVSHESRYVSPFPIYANWAKGSRKRDIDGNEYIDYSMGSASLLLGHSHPSVVEALKEQVTKGTFYANCHPLEIEWAARVQDLIPSAERVRFVASGTEATMLAIRLARAYTGKSKIIRFEGHYHGWHDYAALGVKPPFHELQSAGVLKTSAEETLVCPADIAQVEETFHKEEDIAAIICEVSGASWGTVPLPEGFLPGIRALAKKHKVVLIFDEIITGFRWNPGGVQAMTGVIPDLTTLAKILTGGLPGGAVAGCEKVMRLLDPQEQVGGFSPAVFHRGTFNGNPLAAAAGVAVLDEVRTGKPQRAADSIAAKLRDGFQKILKKHEVAGAVYGESSTFHIFFGKGVRGSVEGLTPADLKGMSKDKVGALQSGLRTRGVDLMSYTGGVTSCAHTEEDVALTLDAFEDTIRDLAGDGNLDLL